MKDDWADHTSGSDGRVDTNQAPTTAAADDQDGDASELAVPGARDLSLKMEADAEAVETRTEMDATEDAALSSTEVALPDAVPAEAVAEAESPVGAEAEPPVVDEAEPAAGAEPEPAAAAEPEPAAAAEPEPAAAAEPELAAEPVPVAPVLASDPSPADNLRVAHVLLRMGSPMPARAHLEMLAGANGLDRQGLLDLAESRWRTGDLPGAGEATVAYFEQGGGAPLAYLIAAEATAATGRPSEASRFARRALDGLTLPLDAVFAGQPRSPIWPNDPSDPGQQAGTLFAETSNDPRHGGRIGLTSQSRAPAEASPGRSPAASGGVGVMAAAPADDRSNGSHEGRPDRSLWDEPLPIQETGPIAPSSQPAPAGAPAPPETVEHRRSDEAPLFEASSDVPSVDRDGLDPALPDVGVELNGARDDLAAGDHRAAAVRLAVVLRLRPALAPAVLDVIGDLPGPDFDLLRGDALRLVGHEAAAQRAFASAASALPEPSDPRRDA